MIQDSPKARSILFIVIFLILGSTHLFYPKWQNTGSEAIISWDVYGYYLYLPAFFIYDDWKELKFIEDINAKYNPAGQNYKTTILENGNATGQYSLGWAILHAPAFALGHLCATMSSYPSDGFSKPYQIALSFYGILLAYLGIIFSYYNLRKYFSFQVSALIIVLVLLASNALNYFAIDSAHTHGPLFFLYASLISLSISWYKKQKLLTSFAIGLILGLMCTIRPTEIIALIIPIFWGLGNWQDLKLRLALLRKNLPKLSLSFLAFLIFPLIQFIYWKVVTSHFLFYSYVGQTFSWLHPHILDVLISHRKGWLMYTPFALLFIIGLPFLYKKTPKLFFTIFVFFLINFYIVASWDIWWYGGSLGQRALVQSYALLIFPLAALIYYALQIKWAKILLGLFCIFSILHNLSFHYKAHSAAPFEAEAMTKAFFSRTYFEFKENPEFFKLLDTNFIFEGEIEDSTLLEVAKDTLILTETDYKSKTTHVNLLDCKSYFRLNFLASSLRIQSYYWNMPQINISQFNANGDELKTNFIRVHRFLTTNESKELYFDIVLKPEVSYLEIFLSNPHGAENLEVQILEALCFNTN